MVEQGDLNGDAADAPSLAPVAELTALSGLLRQARIDQGLSLAELAARLHMGLEQLRALEEGDRAALPEPVFVIAQARRVAAALGLEIAAQITALRDSEAFNQKAPPLDPAAFQPSAARMPVPASRSTLQTRQPPAPTAWRWGLVVVVVALVPAGLWWQRDRLPFGLKAARLAPPASKPALVQKPLQPPASKPPQGAPQKAVLLVRSARTSWLEVQSLPANGPLFRGMFKGERTFPLGQGIRLLAGRPDQLQVAIGSQPPRTLGTIKDIRWFSFRPQGQPQAGGAPQR